MGVVGSCKDIENQWVSAYARPLGGLASLGLKFRILGSLLLENSFYFRAVFLVQNCSFFIGVEIHFPIMFAHCS